MTNFVEALNDSNLIMGHGPDVDADDLQHNQQIAVASWLAEYVADNCDVNDAEPMTLEEALCAYAVVFEDEETGERVDVYLTHEDLGGEGIALFESEMSGLREAA